MNNNPQSSGCPPLDHCKRGRSNRGN